MKSWLKKKMIKYTGLFTFAGGMITAALLGIRNYGVLEAKAQSFAADIKSYNLDGITVDLNQDLKENGDGTYSLNLKTSSYLNHKDSNVRNTEAKYGFFKAPQDGKYLFEIYGGKGASGEDTKYSKGGKGGAGAHLVASLSMLKGEYIFYTIGGDGQPTVSNDSGGGANGSGGDHGDTGSYIVGGGGGLTAVYYFDQNHKTEFEKNYLSGGELVQTSILESDRISKYIMIAGGGGGGGAGNAFSLTDKAVRAPDGGSAGQMNSPSGELTIADSNVPGTYYVGSDGYSSGKNLNYVGKGGSNVPGEVNSTYFEWFNGKQPNDWLGTANPNFDGGSGGSGNLRGGAGGAGYAGASGGVMSGLLIGTNVGGGGGGSSFVSSKLSTSLTSTEELFVLNENESNSGGCVYISYVPDEATYACLNNLTISGSISKYFDIVGTPTVNHGSVSVSGNSFTVTGAKASPQTSSSSALSTTLTLTVKPVDGFMGGNDVPIFNGDSIKFDYVKDATPGTFNVVLSDVVKYVNVPLAFELTTNNYIGSSDGVTPYAEKKAKDLFVDNNYVSKLGTEAFDFIDNVSAYKVKDAGGNEIGLNDTLSVKTTTSYNVSFDVSPKSGSKAVVGEKHNNKTYTKKAEIVITDPSIQYLNGNAMTYSKTLNYNQSTNQYELTLDVSTSGPKPTTKTIEALFPFNSAGTGSYTIPETGIYELHVWGGDGGKGGTGYSDTDLGGDGGSGGYISEYYYLTKGNVISYSVGADGIQPTNRPSNPLKLGYCGTGGKATTLSVDGTVIIGAGGGGGGGGGAWGGAGTGVSVDNSLEKLGSSATDGDPTSSSHSSDGGSAGTNYKNTTAIENNHKDHSTTKTLYYEESDYKNNGGGAVYIRYLDGSAIDPVDKFINYGVTANFTSNFNLVKTSITGATATMSDTNPVISNIQPSKNIVGETIYINFKVTYTLAPNCDGGNDIKLLNSLTVSQTDCNSNPSDDSNAIPSEPKTDYANVAINPAILGQYTLNTNNIDYIQGDTTGVDVNDLATGSTTYSDPTGKLGTIGVEGSFPTSTVYPDETTEYAVSYGVGPTAAPTQAVVGPTVDPLLLSGYATVTVYHKVNYNLSHLVVDDKKYDVNGQQIYIFVPGSDYNVKLLPEDGWDVPNSVSIIIDGQDCSEYATIDPLEGIIYISIPANKLTNTSVVSIEAQAVEKEYKIHYVASLDKTGLFTKEYVTTATAGESGTAFSDKIDALLANYVGPSISGYTYTYEYPAGSKPTEMPGCDVWINGVYNPNPHTLTVHYVDESGEEVASTDVDSTTCYNTKAINIDAKDVTNYAPAYVKFNSMSDPVASDINPANPQFTMPDSDLHVYIVYISTAGKVVINYTCKDNVTLPTTKVIDEPVGTAYNEVSPSLEGYVATPTSVSGSVLAAGETYTIDYAPVSYKITFNSDGGTVFSTDRTVFYNHEIGYTGTDYESATYEPLPTPVKVGHNFLGWYIGNTKVDETTVFTATSNVELKAKWEKKTSSVTIQIGSDDSVLPFLSDVVISGEYGESYNYTFAHVEGYTAPSDISGTYGANNTVVNATYTLNHHDIVVHYKDNDGNTLKVDDKQLDIAYGTSYTVTSSFTDAKYELLTVTGDPTSGTMPDKDLEITFVYKLKIKTVTEDNCTITVAPKTGTEFVYGNEDNTPVTTVYVDGVLLTEGTDYDVILPPGFDKDSAGDKTITVKFKGDYTGSLDKTYTVKGKNIPDADLHIGTIGDQTYTGTAITPEPSVKDGTTDLILGTDYTLTYFNNVDKGTASIVITFINNYSGTASKTIYFNIVAKDIGSTVEVTGVPTSVTYDGTQHKPTVTVTDGSTTLTENVDYVVVYGENTNVGDGTVTIKFINNYATTDNIVKTFEIKPVVIDPTKLSSDPATIPSHDYDGNPYEPKPDIYYEGEKLEEGKDFIYKYEDNEDAPGGKIIIEFINNYEGNDPYEIPFVINPINISDTVEVTGVPTEVTYDGTQHKPTVTVTNGADTLVEGIDYDVEYGPNTDAGEGTVTIKFKGNYEGTPNVVKTFDINPVVIDPTKLNNSQVDSHPYDGTPYEPTPSIYYEGKELIPGTDFTYSYEDNIDAPGGKIIIEFIGNYEGNPNYEIPLTITPINISGTVDVAGVPTDVTYNGTQHKPTVTVTNGGDTLTEGVDYDVEYGPNTDAGEGTVTIKFKGNYEGTPNVVKTFEIKPVVIDPTKLSSDPATIPSHDYDGNPYEPKPDIYYEDKKLEEGTDFIYKYEDNTDAPGGKIIIEFINNYEGNPPYEIPFVINPINITDTVEVWGVPSSEPYNGAAHEPTLLIKDGSVTLVKGVDYVVYYTNNIDAGTAQIIIKFIGNYENTPDIIKEFTITPIIIDINDLDIGTYGEHTFDGKPFTPTPTIVYNGTTLYEHIDFEYVYENNTDVPGGTLTIEFKGNYAGSDPVILPLVINEKVVTDPENNLNYNPTINPYPDQEYTGEPIVPTLTITDGVDPNEYVLKPGVDYIITSNDVESGPAEFTIEFIGNYEGTDPVTVPFNILPKDATNTVKVVSVTNPVYTGDVVKPTLVVKDGDKVLEEGVDYIIESTATEAGPATATIKFIGNYANTKDKPVDFVIEQMPIDPTKVAVESVNPIVFTGSEIEPTPTVKYDGKQLVAGKDFDYTYVNNINVGKATIVITFKGNYADNVKVIVNFMIIPNDISGKVTVTGIPESVTYNGSAYQPVPTVKYDQTVLVENTDYVVVYGDNTDAGTGTVTIRFINNYAGTKDEVITFVIEPVDMDPTKLSTDPSTIPPHEYDGNPYEPKPDIYYEDKKLEEGKDFIYKYEDNTDVPGGKIIIEFIGNYEGNDPYEIPFEIEPKEITDPENELSFTPSIDPYPDQEYTGDPIEPELEIKDGDKVLEEGVDYIIISNDEDLGPAEFVIEFIGNYEGTDPITVPYEIIAKDISDTVVIEPVEDVIYTGEPATPSVVVKDGDKILEEGVDYIVICDDINVGPAEATIQFIGNYANTEDKTVSFKIIAKDAKDTIEVEIEIPEIPYTGDPIEPELDIKDGDKPLKEGEDYIVIYSDNTEPGTATATVVFIGNYADTDPIQKTFEIKDTSLDNRKDDLHSPTVVLEYDDGFDSDIVLSAELKDSSKEGYIDYSALAGRFAMTYGSYDIKLYRNGEEIQPSDLGEDVVLTLKIALPDDVDLDSLVLVHAHSEDDITVVKPGEKAGIGTYIVEGGYIVTLINKLSDFSIISNQPCIAHWFLLTIAVLDLILLASLLILGKKPNKVLGICATAWLIILTAVAGAFAHCTACIVLVSIDGALIIANVLFFTLFKRKDDDETPKQQQVVYVQAPVAAAPVAPVQTASAPVSEPEHVEEVLAPVEEEKADLSLKDSINEAKASFSSLNINKKTVVEYLNKNYSKEVVTNTRENITSTGLPLGDTHYMMVDGKKKCFMYVYELDGKCFFIVRGNDAIEKAIKANGHRLYVSAFPKTRDYARWYTMLVDNSYESNDDVFNNVDIVIAGLKGDDIVTAEEAPVVEPAPVQVEAPAPVEEEKADLSLKDSINEAKASETVLDINKKVVVDFLNENYKKEVITNTRENMTSTGLPLGDTHYMMVGGAKKCFCYVYELEGKCFFIVRGNSEIVKAVKAEGHKIMRSAFPKTRDYAEWYTMLIDDSYKSNEDVFNALSLVIKGLKGDDIVPVEEVPVEEPAPVEEEKADLSLKDSINEAKASETVLDINKKVVVDFLNENYKKEVITNTRENMTSTGLPLGDTHYMMVDGMKKCFCYVYEIDGKCFFIVRGNAEIAKAVKGLKHKFIRSAFPKTRDYAEWYTMLIDDSYKSNEDVFEALNVVINGLKGDKVAAPVMETKPEPAAEVVPEPEKADLSLKDSINEAKANGGEVVVNKEVIVKFLNEKYAKEVVTNTRANMTSTGLPLGDTHYMMVDGMKKCFCYVYDIDGNCFLIVRGNADIVKDVKAKNHKLIRSAFPKTRDYAEWYTMLIDNSYKSMDDVYETLDAVISGLKK